MTAIAVCPLSMLEDILQQTGAHFLLSLLSSDTIFDRPDQIEADNHLVLRFNDIIAPHEDLILPDKEHIRQLISFAKGWDQELPLVVHCWAGVSRSPAAAAIIAMALNPIRNVQELAATLRDLSPSMTPNIKMIELADTNLELDGLLLGAIGGMGRGEDTYEGNSFQLPIY